MRYVKAFEAAGIPVYEAPRYPVKAWQYVPVYNLAVWQDEACWTINGQHCVAYIDHRVSKLSDRRLINALRYTGYLQFGTHYTCDHQHNDIYILERATSKPMFLVASGNPERLRTPSPCDGAEEA